MTTRESPAADADRAPTQDLAKGSADMVPPVGTQLRARRAAAWRCCPLDDGRRDPLDLDPTRPTAATYALTRAERAAESARLLELGWFPAEVHVRLDLEAA
jgi:hypothetical protein